MDKPTIAILLLFGVHLVGIGALVWLALGDSRLDWRGWWPRDDDGGEERTPPVSPPPLPDADPPAVRLRTEHDRLAAARRGSRRPAREPDAPPARTPTR